MITLRYKQMKSGKYSIYLDAYIKDKSGISKRSYEFLEIYVSKDYSKVKNVLATDKEKMELAKGIKAKREIEIINDQYSFKKKTAHLDLIAYIEKTFDITSNNIYILIKHIKDYSCNKAVTFADVTYDWLEGFKKYLLSDKLQIKQNTAHNYLSRFKTILNKAIKSSIINENPFKNVDIPQLLETDRTCLDMDELKLLIKNPIRNRYNHNVPQMFLFSCFTGLRLSDCLALTWNDVDNDKLKIRIKKTQKLLSLPLTEQAKEILKEIARNEKSNKVFWNVPTHQRINLYLHTWGYEAGLKKHLHFHVARHSFATIGLTYGIDLYSMKELLGHKKIEHTQVYAKIVDEKKKQEIAKFPTL